MSESSMRSLVTKTLKPLHAVAVENPALPGTPDVNYNKGWIELKELRAWPIRPQTIVKIKHFTPEQRLWIRERSRAHGNIYLILKVRSTWLILPGLWSSYYLGKTATQSHIISKSLLHFPNVFNPEKFLEFFL